MKNNAKCVDFNLSNFNLSMTNPGDPTYCNEWSVKNLGVTTDETDCGSFQTELGIYDYAMLCIGGTFLLIMLFFICPISPLHKWCKHEYYEAAQLEIYHEILKLRGM